MPRRPLGAHMSIAGGHDRALQRGAAIGCSAIQLFTKSSNQWAAKPLSDEGAARFRAERRRSGIERVVAHDSYLINLCSPDRALWRRSIEACALELERCARLGIPWLVTHPGGHMGRGEEYGVRRMAEAIDAIHERVPAKAASLALETTAGQGTVIGYRFEQIAAIIARARDGERVGVCLDTCHVFAAGYDIRTPAAYRETMRRLDGEIGLDRLCAVHVNDSKREMGSRVDRHEHIGRGSLGLDAFRSLMNDPRLVDLPLLLETPKGNDCREDVENLTTLIRLVGRPAAGARA
ncbi:MAG: deoxyribonuclease IV [Acidobacteriota bacterium]